jgi:hypothetical protein
MGMRDVSSVRTIRAAPSDERVFAYQQFGIRFAAPKDFAVADDFRRHRGVVAVHALDRSGDMVPQYSSRSCSDDPM